MYLLAKCFLPMESLFQPETFYTVKRERPLLYCSDCDDKQVRVWVLEKMLNGWKVFFSVGKCKKKKKKW